jgi:tetratricopeptide (TPR) repeat protein
VIDQVEQEIRTLRSIFWSDRDPDGRAFAPLADAYCRAGRFRQAVELLIDGRKRHPDFATGHAVAARLFMERGLLEEAELAARRVLELDEDNVMALRLLAEALEAKGAAADAASARARLQVLEPGAEPEVAPEVEEGVEPEAVGTAEAEAEAPAAEEPEAAEAEVTEAEAPAAEEPEAADEEEVDIAALAPEEPEAAEEEVMDIAALAPEEPEAAGEDVVDIAALAPEEPEAAGEDVMDIAAPAPEEPEDVVDIAALAPDRSEEPEEPEAGELESLPEPGAEHAPPLVTRTMADLYARQGFTERALEVYRELLEVRPHDAEIRDRIISLEASLREGVETTGETAEAEGEADVEVVEDVFSEHVWRTQAHAEGHEVETPFAWTAEEPEEVRPSRPPISEYFQRLLSWGVGADAEADGGSGGASDGAGDDRRGEGGVTSGTNPA